MNKVNRTYILGIDPSYSETGIALLDLSCFSVLMADTVKTSAASTEEDRLHVIHKKLTSIIRENDVMYAAIETPYVGKNSMTAIKLGSVRGVCFLTCRLQNVRILTFNPMHIKATVTGKTTSDKVTVARMVASMTGYKTANHNISDAIAVAICGALGIKGERLVANAR